jgi:hypothetical protein
LYCVNEKVPEDLVIRQAGIRDAICCQVELRHHERYVFRVHGLYEIGLQLIYQPIVPRQLQQVLFDSVIPEQSKIARFLHGLVGKIRGIKEQIARGFIDRGCLRLDRQIRQLTDRWQQLIETLDLGIVVSNQYVQISDVIFQVVAQTFELLMLSFSIFYVLKQGLRTTGQH